MISDPLAAIAVITTTAVFCQWLGSRLNIPSVLFLLVAGVSLSPVLDPDAIFGDVLFTGVGLGVAILLFEGGTGLDWKRLDRGRATVIRLVTVGALTSWIIGTTVAYIVLDIDFALAVLIGAILIVSGPTVVMPLLRVVRPREPTRSILQWEGILIDPVGAGLAIVVLDAMIEDRSWPRILARILTTMGAGLLVGAVVAALVLWAMQRYLVSDHLHVPVTLAAIIGSYAAANELRPEAGLVAVTLLGMAFANQRRVAASHIAEFNENLGSSVLGVLFIVLGARVELDDVLDNIVASLVIAAVLMVIARPLTVLASTVGTNVKGRDRSFLMTLAPRGVVAAAVASLFAIELDHHDIDPGPLVPVVFSVVMITVAVAGTTARYSARRLRVAQPAPNGVALIGGGRFGFDFADALAALGVGTLHIGLSDSEVTEAAERGQLAFTGRLDSRELDDAVQGLGVASAVALSGLDHLDAYVSQRLIHLCGRANVFGLSTDGDEGHGTGARAILPSYIDAKLLRTLTAEGAQLRTVTAPLPQGDDDDQDEWLTLVVVSADAVVSLAADPSDAEPGDSIVQMHHVRVPEPDVDA